MSTVDPAFDLAVHLFTEAQQRSPSLTTYLLVQSRFLPSNPVEADGVLRQRWPTMTDEERDLAFVMARNVLRSVAQDCQTEAERLTAFIDMEGGNA